jgi:hypothetical protein
MKALLLLFLMTLLPCWCWAQSMQQLEDKFTSGRVSQEELRGFEQRAIQKLHDFGDYLQIIADKQLDDKLRKEAIKQAEGIFADSNCQITIDTNPIPLALYLQKVYTGKVKVLYISEEISVATPLTYDSDGYSGILQLHNGLTYSMKLLKVEKKFGDEVKEVWDVRLCD